MKSSDQVIAEGMKILELAADGLTYPQMAPYIGKAAGTIKNQAKVLLDAMGADNIHHAVALGFRRKLLQ
jgi:DNA-binding NarL/FixJ family response regulator